MSTTTRRTPCSRPSSISARASPTTTGWASSTAPGWSRTSGRSGRAWCADCSPTTTPAATSTPARSSNPEMHDVWVLRHGESTANAAGLIVSVPGPRALTEVGLTALGREQARTAAERAAEQGLGAGTLVLTSDFARARETAEEFRSEEHTSELQSRGHLVCRLLLEKKEAS